MSVGREGIKRQEDVLQGIKMKIWGGGIHIGSIKRRRIAKKEYLQVNQFCRHSVSKLLYIQLLITKQNISFKKAF